jgi:hypothetical protein
VDADRIVRQCCEELPRYFTETAHDVAFKCQRPLGLESFLGLFVLEERRQIVAELAVEGGSLCKGGEQQEKLYFGVVHLSIDYLVEGKLFVRLRLKLLQLFLGQANPVLGVSVDFELLSDQPISFQIHGKI